MSGANVDCHRWLASLESGKFDQLATAAETLLSIHEALANDGICILNELLREHGEHPIETWVHYPSDDCLDPKTGAMFYYHAHHPKEWQRDEHGHFHLFVRPAADAKFSHVMAISMTAYGLPKTLFTTNRWVTDETLLPAAELLQLLDKRWEIARARPSWMLAQWLTALVKLARPYTEVLLERRDRAAGLHGEPPASPPILPDDRTVHILSELRFDLIEILTAVQNEMRARAGPDRLSARSAFHVTDRQVV